MHGTLLTLLLHTLICWQKTLKYKHLKYLSYTHQCHLQMVNIAEAIQASVEYKIKQEVQTSYVQLIVDKIM